MSDWLIIFILTLATGLAMVVGALFASIEHISNRWLETEFRHSVIAFGGGILIAAVSLVLVHEGMQNIHPILAIICFGFGGLAFMVVDTWLNRRKEKASQLAAMLLDFLPEVLALGALYLLDKRYAILLAFLIIFQNLPEGFNAYLELCKDKRHQGKRVIGSFFAMSFLGPFLGLLGYFFLSEHPEVISAVMLFASGGILYLIFQDIAPLAKLQRSQAPALGAVGGFLFGMIGQIVIQQMR